MGVAVDKVYAEASRTLGRSEADLRAVAVSVFASMLWHALSKPGEPTHTVLTITPAKLDCEVEVPPRRRTRAGRGKPRGR